MNENILGLVRSEVTEMFYAYMRGLIASSCEIAKISFSKIRKKQAKLAFLAKGDRFMYAFFGWDAVAQRRGNQPMKSKTEKNRN